MSGRSARRSLFFPGLSRLPSQRRRPCDLHHYCSPRNNSMASSAAARPANEPLTPGTVLKSDLGHSYKIEEVIAERRNPLLCVYRASDYGKRKYIMKNVIPGAFEYQLNLQKPLRASPNVRAAIDTNLELDLFIYPFLAGDLLGLSPRDVRILSQETRRSVLRSALRGLADLHDRSIVHNDYEETADGQINTISSARVSDLEDTVIVPPGKWLRGPLCGNQLWRSPESWARSRQNHASDIFSFGIVMIYVMINEMVFLVSDDQLNAPDSWRYILRRHLSYFADKEGFNGFLAHIGEENPFYQRLIDLANDFPPGNRRQPFALWEYVEPGLRELIGNMTSLDPTRRISARDALTHPWFKESG